MAVDSSEREVQWEKEILDTRVEAKEKLAKSVQPELK